MPTFSRLRVCAVLLAWIAAGFAVAILYAINIVQSSLGDVPPDGTTGVTFFVPCLKVGPLGVLAGATLGAYNVRQRNRRVSR